MDELQFNSVETIANLNASAVFLIGEIKQKIAEIKCLTS